ncbi:MAG: hypothetical protein K2O01_01370 [Bacteroidales bacterium]|nr:hypothetical protein [Bacteroidales bacterium]
MRHLSIFVAAVAVLVLFTACPNKPTDEPVVIPDGTYEETAHYRAYRTYPDTQVVVIDTFISAIVDIADRYFVYRDMCQDTYHYFLTDGTPIVRYKPCFVYFEEEYCHECQATRYPAQVTDDGFVLVEKPSFSGAAVMDLMYQDSSYRRKFRISRTVDGYQFEQAHDFYANYRISHTLKPLAD